MIAHPDRPAFDILPGDPASTVILHVPHSSRDIPADVRRGILLDDDALEAELDAMTDAFTDLIAERAAVGSSIRPWIFRNNLSRYVIDPERFPDEREELNAVGMGAVYTRSADGEVLRTDDEIPELIDRFFTPYATAFTALVDERLAAVGEVTIIDVHSYPVIPNAYELHTDGPRPEICLGTDPFHTPDELLSALQVFERHGFSTAFNTPFGGCYVPLKHYSTDRRVRGAMIEIRRDVIGDAQRSLVPGILAVGEAIHALVDDPQTAHDQKDSHAQSDQ